jgi:hypothetical protein
LINPVDPLGLVNVGLKLDPTPQGFDYRATGGSYRAPRCSMASILHRNQPATIRVADFAVSGTQGQGQPAVRYRRLHRQVDLAGGTIAGPIALLAERGMQKVEGTSVFTNATLGRARASSSGGDGSTACCSIRRACGRRHRQRCSARRCAASPGRGRGTQAHLKAGTAR